MAQGQDVKSDEKKFLLIVNEKDGSVRIAGIPTEKDQAEGKVRDVAPKDGPEHFLQLEGRDMVDEYIRNYQRQNEYPQGLKWIGAPIRFMDKILNSLFQVKEGESAAKTLEPYSQYETKASFKRNFEERDIPWKKLEKVGWDKEFLQKTGLDKKLMRGEPLPLKNMTINSKVGQVPGEFSTRLVRNPKTGEPMIRNEGYRDRSVLQKPFMGYEFSKEEQKKLMKDKHLGKPVQLTDPKTGQKFEALVSVHPYTNEPHFASLQHIHIPDNIKSLPIDQKTQEALKRGEALKLQGMTAAGGKQFGATLQYDAFLKKLDFKFDNPKQRQAPKQVGKVKLTEEMRKAWDAGQRIDLGEPIKRSGEPMSPIIFKGEDGKINYDNRNKDEVKAYKAQQGKGQAQDSPGQSAPAPDGGKSKGQGKGGEGSVGIYSTGPVSRETLNHDKDGALGNKDDKKKAQEADKKQAAGQKQSDGKTADTAKKQIPPKGKKLKM